MKNKDKIVTDLRNRMTKTFWDSQEKMFVRFRINREEKRICWMRQVSIDRRRWIDWNCYLKLSEVITCIEKIRSGEKVNLSIVII
jgi:hypothetical protein